MTVEVKSCGWEDGATVECREMFCQQQRSQGLWLKRGVGRDHETQNMVLESGCGAAMGSSGS